MIVFSRSAKFTAFVMVVAILLVASLILRARESGNNEITRLKEPVPLVGNFMSLMTSEQVRTLAGLSASELERLLEPVNVPNKNARVTLPVHRWFSIQREKAIFGFSGKLQFEFYHDRLARLVFFPDEYEAFLNLGMRIPEKQRQREVMPTSTINLRVVVGPRHIVWMDERIMKHIMDTD